MDIILFLIAAAIVFLVTAPRPIPPTIIIQVEAERSPDTFGCAPLLLVAVAVLLLLSLTLP